MRVFKEPLKGTLKGNSLKGTLKRYPKRNPFEGALKTARFVVFVFRSSSLGLSVWS